MNVHELMELLKRFPCDAVVVIGDDEDGGVGTLRAEDLRQVGLRFGEANGKAWYEFANDGSPADVQGLWIA